MALKADGATTVSATMLLAAAAGIKVFVTGGIGGVHRCGACMRVCICVGYESIGGVQRFAMGEMRGGVAWHGRACTQSAAGFDIVCLSFEAKAATMDISSYLTSHPIMQARSSSSD